MTRRTLRRRLLAALLAGAYLASPALPAASAAPPAGPVFAKESYWRGFADFWTSRLKQQDGIVLLALGVGAISLFIITRTKWKK